MRSKNIHKAMSQQCPDKPTKLTSPFHKATYGYLETFGTVRALPQINYEPKLD